MGVRGSIGLRLGEGLDFDAEDGGEVVGDGVPGVAAVGGAVDLAAGGAEVDAAVGRGCRRPWRRGGR